MTYLISIPFLALAVIFWQLNSRDQYNKVAIGHGVLTILVFYLIGQDIIPIEKTSFSQGIKLFSILSGILVVNMVFSHFWKKKAQFWPPIFVLVSSSTLLLIKNETFNYIGFPVGMGSIGVLILPFLGACIVPIANMKEKILGDLFKIDYKNRRGFSRSVYFFLFGAFILFAHFLASYLGIALITLGFASSLFYNKKSAALWNMLLTVLSITILGHFASEAKISTSSLLLGRVIAGVFLGGFLALFVNTMQRARNNKLLGTLACWFFMLLIPSILIFGGTININFGGGESFIGLLVGFALAAAFGINTRKNDTVLAVYIALGILLIPLTINKEQEEMSVISISEMGEAKVTDPFELDGTQINLSGKYSINSKNSQLTFELGPKGSRTKGAFKKFQGTFEFGEENHILVEVPVNSLTTFNGYRDESLMEETYFFESRFPVMQFESTGLEPKSSGYEVIGNFTMLGTTKEVNLEMKYLGKSKETNKSVFIGRSSLNRVDFGMQSDPTEGDVVDFEFKVELDNL